MTSQPLLDTRGMLCPIPVLLTAKRSHESPPGTRITAVGDDLGILEDIPAWCNDTGHRLIELEQRTDGIYWIVETRQSVLDS